MCYYFRHGYNWVPFTMTKYIDLNWLSLETFISIDYVTCVQETHGSRAVLFHYIVEFDYFNILFRQINLDMSDVIVITVNMEIIIYFFSEIVLFVSRKTQL